MKFFIPAVKDAICMEDRIRRVQVLEARYNCKISDALIMSIKWRWGNKKHRASVGLTDTLTGGIPLLICEGASSYMIITSQTHSGDFEGQPILIPKELVYKVKLFKAR